MTDIVEIEPGPERDMQHEEQQMAEAIYAAVMTASRYSERALQQQSYQVGVSDLGYCSERTKRMLTQEVPEDTDVLAAFIGTAMGDHIERAIKAHLWPDAILQAEVTVPLRGETRTYNVPGHPDIIRPDWGIVDVKTGRGLTLARRVGLDMSKQYQRHCYAYGAWTDGYFGDMALEDVMVGNVWFDRAGDDKECYVQAEPFDMGMVESAAMWLDEVVYSYTQGTEARKEPPREVCAVTCGFFETCRLFDTDVTGLLTDETILAAIAAYREGLDMEKAGKRLKDQAKPALVGVSGSTGQYALRWIELGPAHVEFDRKPSMRIDLRDLKSQGRKS